MPLVHDFWAIEYQKTDILIQELVFLYFEDNCIDLITPSHLFTNFTGDFNFKLKWTSVWNKSVQDNLIPVCCWNKRDRLLKCILIAQVFGIFNANSQKNIQCPSWVDTQHLYLSQLCLQVHFFAQPANNFFKLRIVFKSLLNKFYLCMFLKQNSLILHILS